jgi:hypothetical protein
VVIAKLYPGEVAATDKGVSDTLRVGTGLRVFSRILDRVAYHGSAPALWRGW